MRATTLRELMEGLKGELIQDPVDSFSGIGTDTRKDLRGQLFWALVGENFNAHHFLPQAVENGATGLIVHELPPNWQIWGKNVTIVKVPDTLRALQDFALFIRRRSKARVIGITGSNGKTSTKEFAATLISGTKKVHSNKGSFNNHFGLPFNLLSAPVDSEVILAEMGMNHAGEIERLCAIAEPDVVTCTTVGTAHIEFFGGIEKIAEAKEEIYRFCRPQACRVFNLDNSWTAKMLENIPSYAPGARVITFTSSDREADVSIRVKAASETGLEIAGKIGGAEGEAAVALYGRHQATNLAAAAGLALAVGVEPSDIWARLSQCRSAWGRMQSVRSDKGFTMLFDGYNASPESMAALFETLKDIPRKGKRYAVLAEMKEQGGRAEIVHRELGVAVGALKLDGVWFYGPSSAAFRAGIQTYGPQKNIVISNDYEVSLASEFASMLNAGDLVVVKGSRGMKTERFVEACQPLQFSSVKKD